MSAAVAGTYRLLVERGEAIVVDWRPPRPGSPTAVFVHGLGSHRRGGKALHFAERFAARGWGFLVPDLRGHGESDGSMAAMTMTGLLADLACALDWLGEGCGPLLLIGSSMGGALIAWETMRRPGRARAAMMIAPSLAFPRSLVARLSPAEREAWRRTGRHRLRSQWIDLEVGYGLAEDAARYDPGRLEREYRTPTLIFHGMADEAVDWRQSLAFVERCSFPALDLTLIKGGDHRLTDRKRLLFDATIAWWESLEEDEVADRPA